MGNLPQAWRDLDANATAARRVVCVGAKYA